MPHSPDFGDSLDAYIDAFAQAIDDCLELYRSSACTWNQSLSTDTPRAVAEATSEVMQDLARGLIIKIFLTIVQADKRFSLQERHLAQVLIAKVWDRSFSLDEVGPVLQELVAMADKFDWYSLVRPFEQVAVLRDRTSEVETIVMRLGNLVAKVDGTLAPQEALQLKHLSAEIARHLRAVPLEEDDRPSEISDGQQQIAQAIETVSEVVRPAVKNPSPPPPPPPPPPPSGDDRLQAALKTLDDLIGLQSIKDEVRELARFLQVQKQREQAGLPKTQISLHTVFAGNPGTGKTSVARILGEVFGALGVVSKGHLIEADRAALVAGYAGQTAERTGKVVDKALDGVLFIDEAYSLISDEGDDPYGHEAVQVLLKRMEDDRARLVVVLAGYPAPMEQLLRANPGLLSRFQRTFTFPDYNVVELCRIFTSLCEKNHYVLPSETRARLILGFQYLLEQRDEHFGNGRLVRNAFEQAIRRLANRVADVVPLTKELLTELHPNDIVFADVPEATLDLKADCVMLTVACPGCKQPSKLKAAHLGRRVRCKKCQLSFTAEWGEPAAE